MIQEEYTDTLTEAYSPADTVAILLKDIQSRVTDTHQERMEMVNRRTQSLRLSGLKLSQKVNQLLSTIEEEEQALAQKNIYKRNTSDKAPSAQWQESPLPLWCWPSSFWF